MCAACTRGEDRKAEWSEARVWGRGGLTDSFKGRCFQGFKWVSLRAVSHWDTCSLCTASKLCSPALPLPLPLLPLAPLPPSLEAFATAAFPLPWCVVCVAMVFREAAAAAAVTLEGDAPSSHSSSSPLPLAISPENSTCGGIARAHHAPTPFSSVTMAECIKSLSWEEERLDTPLRVSVSMLSPPTPLSHPDTPSPAPRGWQTGGKGGWWPWGLSRTVGRRLPSTCPRRRMPACGG